MKPQNSSKKKSSRSQRSSIGARCTPYTCYVSSVADWQYSSFHRLVCEGIYPPDWGGNDEITQYDSKDFGE